jgi:hypothetical protein
MRRSGIGAETGETALSTEAARTAEVAEVADKGIHHGGGHSPGPHHGGIAIARKPPRPLSPRWRLFDHLRRRLRSEPARGDRRPIATACSTGGRTSPWCTAPSALNSSLSISSCILSNLTRIRPPLLLNPSRSHQENADAPSPLRSSVSPVPPLFCRGGSLDAHRCRWSPLEVERVSSPVTNVPAAARRSSSRAACPCSERDSATPVPSSSQCRFPLELPRAVSRADLWPPPGRPPRPEGERRRSRRPGPVAVRRPPTPTGRRVRWPRSHPHGGWLGGAHLDAVKLPLRLKWPA